MACGRVQIQIAQKYHHPTNGLAEPSENFFVVPENLIANAVEKFTKQFFAEVAARSF
jgi:hypothetical protein